MIDATPPALAQMIAVFDEVGGPVILVERVPKDQISGYGVIAAEPVRPGVYRILDLVEKPRARRRAVRSRHHRPVPAHAGRLRRARGRRRVDRAGEIQLTNGLKRLLAKRPLYACEITGTRHDTGNKLGFLKAVVYFALRRPDLAGPFRDYLKSLNPA